VIKELAFVVYPVSDMDRARRFYERTLGLKLESNFQNEWIEYDLKGTTFAVTTMDAEHQPGTGGALVAFEVDDVEFVIERLRFLEVKLVKELQTTPVCQFAVIHDPDGNELVIHQRKS
jgi:catechol 2,3-dioxygenase-like lactoylglutathione lyase family enzyme